MRIAALLVLLTFPAFPQSPEIATQEETFTFKSKVNLVLVPVVVRDKKGQPVSNLKQEDFQLFDRGKPQTITKFSIEHPGSRPIPLITLSADGTEVAGAAPRTVDAPSRFVAYLFDDIHMEFGNLAYLREAARKHFRSAKNEGVRFAVYSTSGQTTQEFTEDVDLIEKALLHLQPRPIARDPTQQCPDISYYMGDLISNHHDTQALGAAIAEAIICGHMMPDVAKVFVEGAARQVVEAGQQETRVALKSISDVVRRMAAMPGERTIVLASPGFLRLSDQLSDESAIMDRATRANVTINSLDARGLYTDTPDITHRMIDPNVERIKQGYATASARANADVMAELADGTGGTFFQNNNDMGEALTKLSDSPATYYILGFSPDNMKIDGAFHGLKVSLKTPPGLEIKARRGYYAPRRLTNADEESKEEISQALYSREEMNDIPLTLNTQFFKTSDSEARLAVNAKVDVRKLRFRKVDGKSADNVVIVYALFDRNGNWLQGSAKTLQMKLSDTTLESRLERGVTVRSDFKVTPGTYVIRLVIRDAEGQQMASRNGAVEIP